MDKIINTVSTIFKERYGAQLKIERNLGTDKQVPFFHSHWKNTFVYSQTMRQVSFPIFNLKKELKAIATASPVESQDAVVFDEMAQFLQLTIAEHIELTDQVDFQNFTQQVIESAHVEPNKVVQLRTKKPVNLPTIEYKKRKINKKPDLQAIWLSGSNENFNAQIAFSIHDWISNWAFINAKEIPDLIWKDPHNWKNFPQVTIFIPDISTLPKKKLDVLKQNLSELKRSKGPKPMIVITSSVDLSDELDHFRSSFKNYKVNDNLSARVQAHFLLFHHKKNIVGTYTDEKTKGLYFLPFSPSPTRIH